MSREFSFTVWVKDDPRDLVEWSNALYEAGGSDSLAGVSNGRPYVAFDREADTLDAALRSALQTVQAAGLQVEHCEIPAEEALAIAAGE